MDLQACSSIKWIVHSEVVRTVNTPCPPSCSLPLQQFGQINTTEHYAFCSVRAFELRQKFVAIPEWGTSPCRSRRPRCQEQARKFRTEKNTIWHQINKIRRPISLRLFCGDMFYVFFMRNSSLPFPLRLPPLTPSPFQKYMRIYCLRQAVVVTL